MLNDISKSLRLTGMTIAVCVVAYTALILISASVIAPDKRMGSLIYGADGNVIGSRLVAQAFTRPEYLWPRPSAVDYDASGAGGSNLSPTNLKIRERAVGIIAKHRLQQGATLPADLVTASGSGLDPHISLAAAMIQADRIALSRQVDVSTIRELMSKQAASETTHFAAPEGLINVLEFNILLDATHQPERVSIRLDADSAIAEPQASAYRPRVNGMEA